MPIHQCIGYSDYALKCFFEKASHESWFNNTLFVITADHNNLGYDKPYISFGCDLLTTPTSQTSAVNYIGGVYQYHKGRYLLQFDGKESVALYDFVSDRLLEHNLLGTLPEMQSSMESELKAIIQQYMTRMNTDKLVCE